MKTRIVPGSKENLIEVLDWAGIPYDEGPGRDGGRGPYIQSERFHLYGEYAEKLVKEGKAYRCFCTSERLDALRSSQMRRGVAGMYDRFCLRLTASQIEEKIKSGQSHVIRMKVPPGSTTVSDTVMGEISVANNVVDDQVLLKSDKFPTYHLANVVDDHLMQITHVIRGEEWLPSTPKHIMLYNMFGWKPPSFIHLPLLLNTDRSKLSKRQSHTSVNWYRDQGYMPEAVLNFVALLGWNPGNSDYQEIFTLPELLEKFSIAQVNKSGAIVNLQKLDWLNSQHVRLMAKNDPNKLLKRVEPYVRSKLKEMAKENEEKNEKNENGSFGGDNEIKYEDFDGKLMIKVISSLEDGRFDTLPQLVERTLLFFIDPKHGSQASQAYLATIYKKHSLQVIDFIIERLHQVAEKDGEWSQESASILLKSCLEQLKPIIPGIKKPDVFQVSRYAMAGLAEGPEVPVMMGLVGISKTIERFSSARNSISAFSPKENDKLL